MTRFYKQKGVAVTLALTMLMALFLTPAPRTLGADHGDGPGSSNDQPCDIADVYLFPDPNDSSKVVVIETSRGFIVPGEAVNFGFFDHNVRHTLNFETTGDATPDKSISVTFSPITAGGTAQTATVTLPNGSTFTAQTTPSTLAANPLPPTITNDPASGVSFFAGMVDDPFFFDIPGFARFRNSVLSGAPDASTLQRGRDSFAGYNILAIALSVPVSAFGPIPTGVLGVESRTQRQRFQLVQNGSFTGVGNYQTVDRMGNPGLNVLIVPFSLKNLYNAASTEDDAAGKFAGDIVGVLKALGTNDANIGTLASIYVAKGDFVRLNLSQPAGFPNGRRLQDDVVDTFLFVATNGLITTGDNANGNDVPLRTSFPYLAPPQQPRAPGVIDDNTRN